MPLKHLRTPRRASSEHLGVAAERGRVGNCRFGQFLPSEKRTAKLSASLQRGFLPRSGCLGLRESADNNLAAAEPCSAQLSILDHIPPSTRHCSVTFF